MTATAAPDRESLLPLFRRFPALVYLPRVALGTFPSPIIRLEGVDLPGTLWIKRDDLNAPAFGGNKLRALEFLLGDLRPGETIIVSGGEGSTHVLATAALAGQLGARVIAVRWRHEMNPMAYKVAAQAAERCERVYTAPSLPVALLVAFLTRLGRSAQWIPLGGTSPLGMLGHVNAGLELAEQVARGEIPRPTHVVVPLGSGGTAAGLALGFAIAGLPSVVVGARVVPSIAANRWRIAQLAGAAARLIERLTDTRVPRINLDKLHIVHDFYGGAYGRAVPAAREAAAQLEGYTGISLDDTYSAKAWGAALDLAREQKSRILYWLTFDGRRSSIPDARMGERPHDHAPYTGVITAGDDGGKSHEDSCGGD